MSLSDKHEKININGLLSRELHLLNAKQTYLYFVNNLIYFILASFCHVVSSVFSLSLSSYSLPFLVIFALEGHYLKLTITSFQGVFVCLCLFQAVKHYIWAP